MLSVISCQNVASTISLIDQNLGIGEIGCSSFAQPCSK
jgi:hypothetical protein